MHVYTIYVISYHYTFSNNWGLTFTKKLYATLMNAITKSGHIVDNIYYRANNLININYHSGDYQNGNFDNVTLVYKNNAVTPELAYAGQNSSKTESFNETNLGDFSYGGIDQAALFPKIATYPDKFPMN